MRNRRLALLFLIVAACGGDDGVNHLADAPPPPDARADAAIDAPDPMVTLTTSISGTGTGTVTSSPAGISCASGACSADFDPDTMVTLTAVPGTGSVFAGWGGACTGTVPTCDVTLAQSASVTATFTLARYAVTVTKSGAGTGTVTGGGITCGATCTVMVDHGTVISLSATPGNLSVFAGWGGACSGNTACTVTITADTAISASFPLDTLTLFVTKGGNGAGTVTATGINCGADCDETYTAGQMVTLTATPAAGSTFSGWSGGGCSGTGTCTVTVTAATTVTAMFTLQQFALTVARTGSGTGNVVSNPTGVACGTDCMESYDYNTMVTLTAAPSTGSTFTGWSGACTGTAMCVVTMTQARSVTATFTLMQFVLTTTIAGNGSGTVTSSPAGIACPTDCTQSYAFGQPVTLTAVAATGSTFAGWSGGGCSGTGTCTVNVTAAATVTATFTLDSYTLTVARNGTGTGTVTGTGINCGPDCTETVTFGTMITLTPAPAVGSTFASWSGGGCTGTGPCTVTVSAATTVTATFDLQTFTLAAALAGNGSGAVTSVPAGISCGADCSEVYPYNQVVMLTAAAATGSTFTGWTGGGCSGTGTCTVTMTAARNVTATFTLMQFALTVTPAGAGVGTVTSAPAGINCGATCSASFNYNTVVTLTATANSPSSTFAGWTGACTGTSTCTVTMTQARSVTAAFDVATYPLSVTRNGTGSGSVVSSPAGIDCPAVGCTATYNYPTMVTLTATPDAMSDFAGWTGSGCSGTGTCTVAMTAMRAVTATFNVKTFTVTVVRSGTGTGTVTGGGISCGSTCTTTVTYGSSITLAAAESTVDSTASTFDGWSGACSGAGTCMLSNITGNTTVTAQFTLRPNYMFVTSKTMDGNFGGLDAADTICKQQAAAANLPGNYIAYLSATVGGVPILAPSRVGAATGWIRVDRVPVMNTVSQMTGGTLFNAPRVTEFGVTLNLDNSAWTGTSATGALDLVCGSNWDTTGGEASTGNPSATSSIVVFETTRSCASARQRLYCLGIDRKASVN